MDINFSQLLPIGLDAIDGLPSITPPSIIEGLTSKEYKADTSTSERAKTTTESGTPMTNSIPPSDISRPSRSIPSSPQPPSGGRLPSDSINPALLSLAMGFVPFQAWETPYEADVALQRGTIFPSLDKPFIGEEAVPR